MASWTCIRVTEGTDGVVRGLWMIVRDEVMERPLQLVCPVELRSTMSAEELNKRIRISNNSVTDTKVEEEQERPKRRSGGQAKQRIKDLASESICINIAFVVYVHTDIARSYRIKQTSLLQTLLCCKITDFVIILGEN